MAALAVAQPQEAVGQDAAFDEGVELVLDEARQLRFGVGLGAGDEAGRMVLHQAVQHGLLWAVAFVVQRGAVRRPLGLLAHGLHARTPEVMTSEGLKPRTVSQSPCRAPTCGCLPSGG